MQFLKKFSVFRLQSKTSASVQPPVKSSVTLDSDISGIECKYSKSQLEIKLLSLKASSSIIFQLHSIAHFLLDLIQRSIQATNIKIQTRH